MTDAVSSAPNQSPGPLLPPDQGRDRPLVFVAAILVFLACVAGLGARGAWLAAEAWTSDLANSVTIQVRPVDDRDLIADQAEAAALAAGMAGVSRVDTLDRDYAEALVSPWLGQGNLPEDLPLPLLIRVELVEVGSLDLDNLTRAIDTAGLPATVDDHSRWSGAVRDAARTAQLFGLALLTLLSGAAAAVIAFAARASLAARIDVTDALHLCGAEDRFIAALFQRRFFMLGLKAGLGGAAAAGAVALIVSLSETPADQVFFLPHWALAPFEIGLLSAAPIVAGLISAVSARLAIAADLRARW